jgi:hypothetical protein
MQPAIRRQQQRARRHGENHDQQDHRHHGRHVVHVNAVDDHEPEAALGGEALLKKTLGKRTLQSDYIVGESGSLFNRVRTFDLEGIVAKRMSDPYG